MENIVLITQTQLENLIEKVVRKVLSETPPQYHTAPPTEKEILNVEEAASVLNLAKQSVYSLTSKRDIPFFKRGKKLYFKRADLLKWIDEGKKKSVAELIKETDDYLSRPKNRKS